MTLRENNTYGYKDASGSGLEDDILASSDYQLISITVDATARDATNDTTTTLRRGLILYYNSGTGNYTEFGTSAATASAELKGVVLAEELPNVDDGDVIAKAYIRGTFKTGKLMDKSGTTLTHFDFNKNHLIKVRDNA